MGCSWIREMSDGESPFWSQSSNFTCKNGDDYQNWTYRSLGLLADSYTGQVPQTAQLKQPLPSSLRVQTASRKTVGPMQGFEHVKGYRANVGVAANMSKLECHGHEIL